MSIDGMDCGRVRILVLSGVPAPGSGGPKYPLEAHVDGTDRLRETIASLIRQGGRIFLLDMEKVPFLDSAGIGHLVVCYKRAREAGGGIALLRPAGLAREVLKLTRLLEVFRVFEDEATAIAALKA